jgi:hypothetical protein
MKTYNCLPCDRKRECARYRDLLHRKTGKQVGPALCEEKPKPKEKHESEH